MLSSSHVLRLAEIYAAAVDKPLTTISSRVFDDGKRLGAIQQGGDLTVKRFATALQWFSDNWPAGTEWPADIQRPEPSPPFPAPGGAVEDERGAA